MSLGTCYELLYMSGYLTNNIQFRRTCRFLYTLSSRDDILIELRKVFNLNELRFHTPLSNSISKFIGFIIQYRTSRDIFTAPNYKDREIDEYIHFILHADLPRNAYYFLKSSFQKRIKFITYLAIEAENSTVLSIFKSEVKKYYIGRSQFLNTGSPGILEFYSELYGVSLVNLYNRFCIFTICINKGKPENYEVILALNNLPLLKFDEISGKLKLLTVKMFEYLSRMEESTNEKIEKLLLDLLVSRGKYLEKEFIDCVTKLDLNWLDIAYFSGMVNNLDIFEVCFDKLDRDVLSLLDRADEKAIDLLNNIHKSIKDWAPVCYWFALNENKNGFFLSFNYINNEPNILLEYSEKKGKREEIRVKANKFYC